MKYCLMNNTVPTMHPFHPQHAGRNKKAKRVSSTLDCSFRSFHITTVSLYLRHAVGQQTGHRLAKVVSL